MLDPADEIAVGGVLLEDDRRAARAAPVHQRVHAVAVQERAGGRQERQRRFPLLELRELLCVGDQVTLDLVQVLSDRGQPREALLELSNELTDRGRGHLADELLLRPPGLSLELPELAERRLKTIADRSAALLDLFLLFLWKLRQLFRADGLPALGRSYPES